MNDKVTSGRTADKYTIACICAASVAPQLANALLDEVHGSATEVKISHHEITRRSDKPRAVKSAPVMLNIMGALSGGSMPLKQHGSIDSTPSSSTYTCGKTGEHNVVVVTVAEQHRKANFTEALVKRLTLDFPDIRFALSVGLGSGVPGTADIRLGDVVIAHATGPSESVVQYDLDSQSDRRRSSRRAFALPMFVTAAVRRLAGQHRYDEKRLLDTLHHMLDKSPGLSSQYSPPAPQHDRLFSSSYTHNSKTLCNYCDPAELIKRPARRKDDAQVHCGVICSTNLPVRKASIRDELKTNRDALCIENDAYGLTRVLPCLVIRGVSDYADTHRNDVWRPYASAMAIACARELLLILSSFQISQAFSSYLLNADNYQIGGARTFRLGLCMKNAPKLAPTPFCGRDNDMRRIESTLQSTTADSQTILALTGVGGVGKTNMALEYAKRHGRNYDSVFWLDASTEVSIRQGMRSIARYASLSETSKDPVLLARRWLSDTRNTKWLLIFDNFDDTGQYDLRNYYPYTSVGTIIITTRTMSPIRGEQIHIEPFHHGEDSFELFIASARERLGWDGDAQQLALKLGGHPLALSIAGKILHWKRWDCRIMLEELQKVSQSDSAEVSSQFVKGGELASINHVCAIAYRNLAKRNSLAAQLLLALAHFDPRALSYDILQAIMLKQTSNKNKLTFGDTPEIRYAADDLVSVGFLSSEAASSINHMHNLVHEWILAQCDVETHEENYWFAFDYVALQQQSFNDKSTSQLSFHAAHLTRSQFRKVLLGLSPSRVRKAGLIAKALQEQGDSRAAEIMLEALLVAAEKGNMVADGEVSMAIYDLGKIYFDSCRFDESREKFSQATTRLNYSHESDSLSNLMALSEEGAALTQLGKLKDAEARLTHAMTVSEQTFGKGHALPKRCARRLALLHGICGRYEQAEGMLERLSAIEHIAHEADHSQLDTLNQRGVISYKMGRLDDAEQAYTRLLNDSALILGPDHAMSFTAIEGLGLLLMSRGGLDEAEEMLNQALKWRHRVLGRYHPLTLDTLTNLGTLYGNQGRLEEAMETLTQALTAKGDVLGPTHFSTLDTKSRLANLYLASGKFHEGDEILHSTLEAQDEVLGNKHPSTLTTISNLGMLYLHQGKLEDAENMLRLSLSKLEKVLGPGHVSTLNVVSDLGTLYHAKGRFDLAEKMFNRAMTGQEQSLGAENPLTLTTFSKLGILHLGQGKLQEAEVMLIQAWTGLVKVLGSDHPSTLHPLKGIGMLCYDRSDFAQAEKILSQLLPMLENRFGPSHPTVLDVVDNLGRTYREQGKIEKAEYMSAWILAADDQGQ